MGGDGGGLGRLRDGVFGSYTVRDGLPSNSIRLISQDREGRQQDGRPRQPDTSPPPARPACGGGT